VATRAGVALVVAHIDALDGLPHEASGQMDAVRQLHEADPSEAIAEPQVSSSTGDAGEAAAARVERRRTPYLLFDLTQVGCAFRACQQRPAHASPPARSVLDPLGGGTPRGTCRRRGRAPRPGRSGRPARPSART